MVNYLKNKLILIVFIYSLTFSFLGIFLITNSSIELFFNNQDHVTNSHSIEKISFRPHFENTIKKENENLNQYTLDETEGQLQFKVRRLGGLDDTTTVRYRTQDKNALSVGDSADFEGADGGSLVRSRETGELALQKGAFADSRLGATIRKCYEFPI